MAGIREQVFNNFSKATKKAGLDSKSTESIVKSLFIEPENPKNFRFEGKTTWKNALDKLYDNNPDFGNLSEFYDIDLDRIKNLYESNSPCEFWVRDRYGNGEQIIYTIYDENLTLEEMVDEMVDI